jgi:hypothetical protein
LKVYLGAGVAELSSAFLVLFLLDFFVLFLLLLAFAAGVGDGAAVCANDRDAPNRRANAMVTSFFIQSPCKEVSF